MSQRIISASAAPYDGYDHDEMLASVARLGFTHVEPAFIVGYTEAFTESVFAARHAHEWAVSMKNAGLACHAMSSHIDLSGDESVGIFAKRMDFAVDIGARVIISNAGPALRKMQFLLNMEKLVAHADALDICIALENPGDGSDSIFNVASEGLALIDEIGSGHVGLNYDAANTASHRPMMDQLAADAIKALPKSIYAHIKDVRRDASGWHFAAIGEGEVGCESLLDALGAWPYLPISIELPLRLYRGPDAKPIRNDRKVALPKIEDYLGRSLKTVTAAFGAKAA